MSLNSLGQKILVIGFIFTATFSFASERPFVVMRNDGLMAEYHGKQEKESMAVYPVLVRFPGHTLAYRFYVTPIKSMRFQDKNLEVVFANDQKDSISLNW